MELERISGTNIYIVEVTKERGPAIFLEVHKHFQSRPKEEKIKMLGIFKNFDDFESVKDFVQGIILDESSIERLEKYAMLSNKRWFEKLLEFEGKLVTGVPFKYFKHSQKEEALEWLKE